MESANGLWFSVALVLLFGALVFLRSKFPGASRRAETVVLAGTTIVFFSVCYFLLPR